MDRKQFLRLADDCLIKVAKWLEDFDPDELDYTSAGADFPEARPLGRYGRWCPQVTDRDRQPTK